MKHDALNLAEICTFSIFYAFYIRYVTVTQYRGKSGRSIYFGLNIYCNECKTEHPTLMSAN